MFKSTNVIVDECTRIQRHIHSLNEKFSGPLKHASTKCTINPFVLLLGNHSSGKSSFINYLLQRRVQVTGVAPTDDNFTVIGSGEEDLDRDGPAFLGDANLGFQGLQQFGPMLIHRTQLKIRSNLALQNVMLVDSPGMIDSPVIRESSGGSSQRKHDRGYNFEAVCRWYAERADVILLFFDPDKPGTTGETLSILTNSLSGLDHKLHIILNKADQFRNIHDFARAYGALCWNLSKVILRKDLPKIHTICLPSAHPSSSSARQNGDAAVRTSLETGLLALSNKHENGIPGRGSFDGSESVKSARSALSNDVTVVGGGASDVPFVGDTFSDAASSSEPVPESIAAAPPLPLSSQLPQSDDFMHRFLDLESARVEVEREVTNAPNRRVDHEISRLTENAQLLSMHCRVFNRLSGEFLWLRLQWGSACFIAVGASGTFIVQHLSQLLRGGLGLGLASTDSPALKRSVETLSSSSASSGNKSNDLLLHLGLTCVSAGVAVAAYFLSERALYAGTQVLLSEEHLDETYQSVFGQEVRDDNELVASLWQRVRAHLVVAPQLPPYSAAVSRAVRWLSTAPRVKAAELQALQTILDKDVALLRAQALAAHTKYI